MGRWRRTDFTRYLHHQITYSRVARSDPLVLWLRKFDARCFGGLFGNLHQTTVYLSLANAKVPTASGIHIPVDMHQILAVELETNGSSGLREVLGEAYGHVFSWRETGRRKEIIMLYRTFFNTVVAREWTPLFVTMSDSEKEDFFYLLRPTVALGRAGKNKDGCLKV